MAAIFSELFGRFGAFTTEIVLFEHILYNFINDIIDSENLSEQYLASLQHKTIFIVTISSNILIDHHQKRPQSISSNKFNCSYLSLWSS